MDLYINEQGQFWDGQSIVIDDVRYINPSAEILAQAGYTIYEPPEMTDEQLLENARDEKIMEIEDYDNSPNVNLFYLAGQPLWLDAQTRQQLRISIEAYQATGAQQVSKWFGGQQYTFPTQVWLQMLNALEVYAAEALNTTEAHLAAVNNLQTIEEIQNYDYTANYPEKLNLTTEWVYQQSQV